MTGEERIYYIVMLRRKWWRFWVNKLETMFSETCPPKTLPRGYTFVRQIMECTSQCEVSKQLDKVWQPSTPDGGINLACDRELQEEGR